MDERKLTPDVQADKQNFLSCLLSYASGGKRKLILSVILSAVSIMAGLVPYYCFYRVICLFMDGTAGMEGILQWSFLAFAAYAVKVLCFGLSTTASHYAAFHILEGLRNRVAERFLHAPLGEAAKHSIGEIKSLMVDKIDEIEPPLAHMVPEGSGHIVLPIVSMTALAVIDWRLFLASLITFPLSIVCMGLTFKISGKNYDKYNQSLAQMNSNIVEYVEGIEVIKAFGRTGESYGKFSSAILDYKTFVVKWLSSTWVAMKLAFALFPSTLLGVLPVALLLGADGAITAAEAALAVMLSMSMVGSLAMLEVFVNELKKVQMTVEELQEYLEMPALPQKGRNADLKGYDVELKDVRFSYEMEEGHSTEEVLHGISLKLPQGSFTALVGPSGSGKSTVARLLSRFYDVADGSISIGGVDICDMPLEQLTGIVSFVAQDNFLFRSSIKENIRMGNPNADDAQVFAAARAAQCEEFIKKLPDGYDTPAGEAGKRLSGGEKQRIAIARMMLKDSPVIILDEATAFTDPENEDKIQKSIRELTNGRGAFRGKTLLVIAHRLSTIKNADNIVVLENGKILAQGKQEELLKTCPLYQDMWAAHIGAKNWSAGSGRTLPAEKEVQ